MSAGDATHLRAIRHRLRTRRRVRFAVNMPPFNVTRRRCSMPATVLAISFLRQQDRFHRARMQWIGDGVRRITVAPGVAGEISTTAARHPVVGYQPEVQSMRALPVIERLARPSSDRSCWRSNRHRQSWIRSSNSLATPGRAHRRPASAADHGEDDQVAPLAGTGTRWEAGSRPIRAIRMAWRDAG